jgi:hypothetical protein
MMALALCVGCGGEGGGPDGYWEGSGRTREVLMDDTFRHLTRSSEFTFWFVAHASGGVVGEIEIDYEAELKVENLPKVTVPVPGGSVSFEPKVGGRLTDLDPRRRFPLSGSISTDHVLTLRIATPEGEREKLEFTQRANVGIGGGVTGGGSVGGAEYGNIVTKIPMTPFSPFTGDAEITRRAGNVHGAHFEEKAKTHAVEWSAHWVRPSREDDLRPELRTLLGRAPGAGIDDPGDDGRRGDGDMAVKLDVTLDLAFRAGDVIALRRILGGRVAEPGASCDGRHLKAKAPAGITIDGKGPFHEPSAACGYGRIVQGR